jgi:SAM-dependent methyltransferase
MTLRKGCEFIPELYNTRAEEIWDVISKRIVFDGKTVLDVGCGRADLMARIWCAGARVVYGIDNSPIELREARLRTLYMVKEGAAIYFLHKNLEHWSDKWPGRHDIIICTSVLPYTIDPDRILQRIQKDCDVAIIECQYAGDGPGFDDIQNDDQMRKWLTDYDWSSVEKIGKSKVVSRNTTRTIWKCTNK